MLFCKSLLVSFPYSMMNLVRCCHAGYFYTLSINYLHGVISYTVHHILYHCCNSLHDQWLAQSEVYKSLVSPLGARSQVYCECSNHARITRKAVRVLCQVAAPVKVWNHLIKYCCGLHTQALCTFALVCRDCKLDTALAAMT